MFEAMQEKELLMVNGGATNTVPVYLDGRLVSWETLDCSRSYSNAETGQKNISNADIKEFRWEPNWLVGHYSKYAYTYHKFRD